MLQHEVDKAPAPTTAERGAARGQDLLGRLPLRFEANEGQAGADVRFVARPGGYTLLLTDTGTVASLPGRERPTLVRTKLLGAKPRPAVVGEGVLPGVTNYLLGRDSKQWQTGIRSYGEVRYSSVYPGIDLAYHSRNGEFEHDFILAPGADPSRIAFEVTGADDLRIDADGDLVATTDSGELRHRRPLLYQDIAGSRKQVDGAFVLEGTTVRFRVGAYDRSRRLVIDPVVVFSTYLGSSYEDTARGVAVDKDGNVYVAGMAGAADFSTKDPIEDYNPPPAFQSGNTYWHPFDAFVAKLAPDGSALEYATYLGSSYYDGANGIAVDDEGSAYVAGDTGYGSETGMGTNDFPTTAGAYQRDCHTSKPGETGSAFVVKLASSGQRLVYATCLGKKGLAAGIAVHGRSAYVVGDGGPPPTSQAYGYAGQRFGCQSDLAHLYGVVPGFVTKLNEQGSSLQWSACLPLVLGGGPTFTGAGRVAVDQNGDAFVAGKHQNDAAIFKLASTTGGLMGNIAHVGGSGSEDGYGIAVWDDSSTGASHPYLAGVTSSVDFPATPGKAFQETNPRAGTGKPVPFLARLDGPATDGSWSIAYATYLSGTTEGEAGGGIGPVNAAYAVAVDTAGRAYLLGHTSTTDFPTTEGALQPRYGGGANDAFFAVVDPGVPGAQSRVYSTYLGGSDTDLKWNWGLGYSIAAGAGGTVHIAGVTASGDFPLARPLQREHRGGQGEAYVLKMDIDAPTPPAVREVRPRGGTVEGGTAVTLTGSGLSSVTGVRFGAVPALDHIVVSDTEVRAVTPPGVGEVAATVATRGGLSSAPTTFASLYYGEGAWRATAPVGGATGGSGELARAGHSATLLSGSDCGDKCGKVLVSGGDTGFSSNQGAAPNTKSAQLYDAVTGTWETTGDLNVARSHHRATVLGGPRCAQDCGKVMVVGGGAPPVELYNPRTGQWELPPEGDQPPIDLGGEPILLPAGAPDCSACGKVMFVGSGASMLYDPKTRTWETSAQIFPRNDYSATLLPSGPPRLCGDRCGNVLVVGPGYETDIPTPSAPSELFDPVTATWRVSRGEMRQPRVASAATLLKNGKVLVSGGRPIVGGRESVESTSAAELYDPLTDSWSPAGSLNTRRASHETAVLPDGRVMAGGGCLRSATGAGTKSSGFCQAVLNTAEIYDPEAGAAGRWSPAGAMTALRTNRPGVAFTATSLASGEVLVVGGSSPKDGLLSSAEIYTPEPLITSVLPNAGPTRGGTAVTITGTNLSGARAVRFGEATAGPERITQVNDTEIRVLTPEAKVVGPVPVSVVAAGGASPPRSGAFTYLGAPGAPLNLVAAAVSETEVRLEFGAAAADGPLGLPPALRRYVVKQSSAPIDDEAGFAAAPALCEGGICTFEDPAPATPGERVSLSLSGLSPGKTYYFRTKALDDAAQVGPMSNSAQVTTPAGITTTPPRCVDLPGPGEGQLSVREGYSLLALPDGTVAGAHGPLYSWFDQGARGAYSSLDASTALEGGRGYWAWFSCPSLITLAGAGAPAVEMALGAYHASMVGNPSGTSPATLSGHDFAARWDPAANAGAGAYRLSGYREAHGLAVGEAVWAFSYDATTLRIR